VACSTHGRRSSENFIGKTEVETRDLSVDGKIILKRISKKQAVRMWIGFICLGIGSNVELL
jgi:hypothetical protein